MADHSMLTTDPAARARPRVSGEPRRDRAGRLHASGVRQHLRAAHAGGLLLVDPGFAHTSRRGARGGARAGATRRCTRPSTRTATSTTPSACAPSSTPASGRRSSRRRTASARFRRYALTHGWNARINQRQFSLPQPIFPQPLRLADADLPRRAERSASATSRCTTTPPRARPTTPAGSGCRSARYLFTGDLIIWQAPNCGNPQKVQRYPVEWADALEAMAGLDAEWLFPGHGLVVQGRDAVRTVLTETARYLRVIIDQVLERMNAGADAGGDLPRRRARSRAGDAALSARQLRPSEVHRAQPAAPVGRLVERQRRRPAAGDAGERRRREIAALAGGVDALVARGRALLDAGDSTLAAHLAEWATRAAPARPRRAGSSSATSTQRRLDEEPVADGAGHLPRRDERRAARAEGRAAAVASAGDGTQGVMAAKTAKDAKSIRFDLASLAVR